MEQLEQRDTIIKVIAIAPFSEWSYEDAKRAVDELQRSDYEIASLYVAGDHFQKGREWVGPGDATTNETIQKQFAPEDVVKEVLQNIANAFSEPEISATPTDDESLSPEEAAKRVEELRSLLSHWWDKRNMQEKVQDCLKTSAWTARAMLRLWVSQRHVTVGEDGVVSIMRTSSFEEAFDMLHVSTPVPKFAAIVTDAKTQDKAAILLTQEHEYLGGKKVNTYDRAEIAYLDPGRQQDKDADTIVRIVYSNNEKPATEHRLRLGGHLLMAEMQSQDIVIDESFLRVQRQLNFFNTIVTRLGETAAFRERYLLNAKPQGIRIPYTEGDTLSTGAFLERDEEGRQWQVIPQARTLGASSTTELVGLPEMDNVGNTKKATTPGVQVIEPVDPQTYISACDGIRRKLLRMASQGHLGTESNAQLSGIAYEQSRAVFEKDLTRRRIAEEGMLREFLLTAILLAETIAGQIGYFTDVLRLVVDQHINPGPRSPDLVRLDMEAHEVGILSLPTAQARIGVEDTDAETLSVQRSPNYVLGLLEKISTISGFTKESLITMLTGLGVPSDILDELEEEEVPIMEPGSEFGSDEGDEGDEDGDASTT